MATVRCPNGHFYDDRQHTQCPYCGVGVELEDAIGQTEKLPGLGAGGHTRRAGASPGPTVARGAHTPARPGADPGATRHIWAAREGHDPVVGWLVCVAGPEQGRDYRIHSERNFIGRAPHMDIALTGDDAISRENHAVLSFNPKNASFRIAPGEGRGLVYVNDEELLTPTLLQPYDRIEIGASTLAFVPFCGERFQWDRPGE
jgi:hypothetical protein